MIDKSNKEDLCLRICKMYIQTGRTQRSLAGYFKMSKSSIGRYLTIYAKNMMDYDTYKKVRNTAKQNMAEVYELGYSQGYNSDAISDIE